MLSILSFSLSCRYFIFNVSVWPSLWLHLRFCLYQSLCWCCFHRHQWVGICISSDSALNIVHLFNAIVTFVFTLLHNRGIPQYYTILYYNYIKIINRCNLLLLKSNSCGNINSTSTLPPVQVSWTSPQMTLAGSGRGGAASSSAVPYSSCRPSSCLASPRRWMSRTWTVGGRVSRPCCLLPWTWSTRALNPTGPFTGLI